MKTTTTKPVVKKIVTKTKKAQAQTLSTDIKPAPVPSIINKDLSPEVVSALQLFSTGDIPKEAIKEHPGKTGKIFKYVKHTYITKKLQDLPLPLIWNYEVLDYQILPDGSPIARGRLEVTIPNSSGGTYTKTVTELGTAAGDIGDKMSQANKLLASASRALCRCVMRMFGVGLEFYDDSEDMTIQGVADAINNAVNNKFKNAEARKTIKGRIKERLDAAGITGDLLIDRFEEVWRIVYEENVKYEQESESPKGE